MVDRQDVGSITDYIHPHTTDHNPFRFGQILTSKVPDKPSREPSLLETLEHPLADIPVVPSTTLNIIKAIDEQFGYHPLQKKVGVFVGVSYDMQIRIGRLQGKIDLTTHILRGISRITGLSREEIEEILEKQELLNPRQQIAELLQKHPKKNPRRR